MSIQLYYRQTRRGYPSAIDRLRIAGPGIGDRIGRGRDRSTCAAREGRECGRSISNFEQGTIIWGGSPFSLFARATSHKFLTWAERVYVRRPCSGTTPGLLDQGFPAHNKPAELLKLSSAAQPKAIPEAAGAALQIGPYRVPCRRHNCMPGVVNA